MRADFHAPPRIDQQTAASPARDATGSQAQLLLRIPRPNFLPHFHIILNMPAPTPIAPPICETDLTSSPQHLHDGTAAAGAASGARQSALLKQGLLREPSAAAPAAQASDEHVAGKRKRPLDKQSFDYVIRSGVAGGVAGCVVSGCGDSTSSPGSFIASSVRAALWLQHEQCGVLEGHA